MITINSQRKVIGTDRYDYDMKGLSTDEKPFELFGQKIVENSFFLEMDTGDIYYLKQQGSSSTTRETLIEEQSFTGTETGGETEVSADVIQVVFDGVTYSCERRGINAESGYEYGATYDEETQSLDFSQYPFMLLSASEDDEWWTEITVADGNEHTIEVYTEETVVVDPVWEKIGSGGSEPSGDGYDINNPVLTVTVSDATLLVNPLGRYFIDNDGYLSFEQFMPSNGDTYTTLVFADDLADDENNGDYIYFADATGSSNKVNCTFNSSTSLVTITDPTKDASITLYWIMD